MAIRILIIMLMIAGMIFPVNWLAANNPEFKTVFVQFSEFSHVIAHLILYSSFALLAVFLFRMQFSMQTGLILLAAVILIGIGQEFLQLQVRGRNFSTPELFDLQVDVAGAYLGWRLSYYLRWWGQQAQRVFKSYR
ncbi:MAG: VanZ family protein [Anaerolineales bacterium]